MVLMRENHLTQNRGSMGREEALTLKQGFWGLIFGIWHNKDRVFVFSRGHLSVLAVYLRGRLVVR